MGKLKIKPYINVEKAVFSTKKPRYILNKFINVFIKFFNKFNYFKDGKNF